MVRNTNTDKLNAQKEMLEEILKETAENNDEHTYWHIWSKYEVVCSKLQVKAKDFKIRVSLR